MILTAFYIFWACILIVSYTYVGYGVVIYFFSKIKRPKPIPITGSELPDITLLIAAYNEEGFIEEKIRNTLALDYPSDKLKVIMVTDGSTDRTPELVAKHPSIQLFHEPERRGKIHAVNRIMKLVTTPIVIFCDANTYLNPEALHLIVRHYADPQVGGVAGEKRIFKKEEDSASGAGEGIYWKYESFLKRKDSEVHSVVGAAGELFSLRTALFEEPPADTIIEDFYISLRIASRGYRFIYEPGAYATESASASVEEEWKRKVRICAGGFQAMARLTPLLNPFRYGILTFQYVSHRVLRWTLAPLALPLILITNMILAMYAGPLYQLILVLQFGFYALAALGYIMRNKPITIKGFFVPYYFAVMNLSVYAGFRRYLKGSQSVVWDKSKRADVPDSKFKVQGSK
jgi:poly-beta-1,6-N-acetyl-D-glucosamine synthase